MNLFTWGLGTLQYAEEMILAASALMGAAGVLLVKARKLKHQLLDVLNISEPKNKDLKQLAEQRNLSVAAKEIGRLL